jgi:hypothetical protein
VTLAEVEEPKSAIPLLLPPSCEKGIADCEFATSLFPAKV